MGIGLFNGLYPAERVLMALGILLFCVFVFAFLYLLLQGRSVAVIVPAFLLPIAMIGYSRLQTVSFERGVASLSFYNGQLQADPTNPAKRAQVTQALAVVAPRASQASSASAVATVADSQFATDQTTQALKMLQRATALDPTAPGVVRLQARVNTLNDLAASTRVAATQPANPVAQVQLKAALNRAASLKLASPAAIAQVAAAQAAAGQQQQAALNSRKALSIQPNQALALHVERELGAAAR